MNWDRIEAEREALQSLMSLLEQAKKCQELYDRAQMALPEPLKRVLGLNGAIGRGTEQVKVATIQPPERLGAPKEVGRDWIRIDVRDATPTSITLAILRAAKRPMPSRDVIKQVLTIQPTATSGSIANLGTRLNGKLIDRTIAGWTIMDPTKAGIIHNGSLWAPPETLGIHELAAHRRAAIIHILGHFNTGLQTVQIVEQLSNCDWLRAPFNKDLVKEDMKALDQEGKVRRRGNTKKWELVPPNAKETGA